MAIYTAPSMSFIDTYVNAAKQRDANREAEYNKMIEGLGGLVKGGVDAYKWQERKNALNKIGDLEDEESKLMSELQMLTGDQTKAGSRSNINAILNGLDFNLLDNKQKQAMGGF